MDLAFDQRLKLAVKESGQSSSGREVQNCNANTVSASICKDNSGMFFCPVIKREVEILNMVCNCYPCEDRRRI